jgi:hypothetical protein
MINKPAVTRDGRWLFPIALWREGLGAGRWAQTPPDPMPRLAYVYETRDQGSTFTRLGGADVPGRQYDEHMIYEKRDGGITWSQGGDSGLGGPYSRFHVRRLQSGRLLLINHVGFTGRSHLTALLSEDGGETWQGGLLDERSNVSYPDAVQAPDGSIYAVYDRERYGARELLCARFTEDDISALRGRPSAPGGGQDRLTRRVVSWLLFSLNKRHLRAQFPPFFLR